MMAKVFGPALSIVARKSIGKAITYQKRPRGHAIMKVPRPSRKSLDDPSHDKKFIRGIFKAASEEWLLLSKSEKESYNQDAKAFAITGYNLFIKKFFMSVFDKIKIWDGVEIVSVTPDGFLDVKSHTPQNCFTQDYADVQVNQEIIIPPSGKRIEVVSVYVSSADNATNVTLQFKDSGRTFFKLYTKNKTAHTGNAICALGGVDEKIILTCPAKTFVSIGYDLK